ncbi:MAG: CDGSH iron-sulfur domain-containing protein [Spirochaetota bacterium]
MPNGSSSPGARPLISRTKAVPYRVTGLENFYAADGEPLPVKPVMALCSCGASKQKPFCDGSHGEASHSPERSPERVPDRVVCYEGAEITIVDNRGVCSHDGSCLLLHRVFDRRKKRWINPNGASKNDIIETIEQCPSGSLSYMENGVRIQDVDRAPAIRAAKNGPLNVEGGVVFEDVHGCSPECKEHYALCRCGGSKNKPFCDGTHLHNGFAG